MPNNQTDRVGLALSRDELAHVVAALYRDAKSGPKSLEDETLALHAKIEEAANARPAWCLAANEDKQEHVEDSKYTFVHKRGSVRVVDRSEQDEPWIYWISPGGIEFTHHRADRVRRAMIQGARDVVDAPTLRCREFLLEALRIYDARGKGQP